MMPELSLRYEKLSEATKLAEEVGGKRDVVTDSKKALKEFTAAKKKKDVGAELEASRELETIIGRLRANTASSPRLSSSAELTAAVTAIDSSIPGTNVRDPYFDSVQSYEDARTSFRYLLSAFVGGFNAAQQLEFSFPPDATS